jgi:integrase
VTEAFKDPDWGAYVWTAMTSGARRGEQCALHLCDYDREGMSLFLRRALYVEDGAWKEKDTKSHQQRRVAMDAESVAVVDEMIDRREAAVAELGVALSPDSYLFSPDPDGLRPLNPDTATQRFERMAKRLGIHATLHSLRHYTATELILAGVDVRTVAGRLGHSGGGATTLRVYTAWISEADQRAAVTLSGRMPKRPPLV